MVGVLCSQDCSSEIQSDRAATEDSAKGTCGMDLFVGDRENGGIGGTGHTLNDSPPEFLGVTRWARRVGVHVSLQKRAGTCASLRQRLGVVEHVACAEKARRERSCRPLKSLRRK